MSGVRGKGLPFSCLSRAFRVCVWGPKQVMRAAVPLAPVVPPGPQFVPASVYLSHPLGAPLPAPLVEPAFLAPGDLLYVAPLALVVPMHEEPAPIPVAAALPTPMDVAPVVEEGVVYLARLASPSWADVVANQMPRAQSVTAPLVGGPFAAFADAALPAFMDVEQAVPLGGPLQGQAVPVIPAVAVAQSALCRGILFEKSQYAVMLKALFELIDCKWVVFLDSDRRKRIIGTFKLRVSGVQSDCVCP